MMLLLLLATSLSKNLLANGDFHLGDAGFTSDYNFNQDLGPEGNYYVGPDPQNCNQLGFKMSPHAGGSQMLLANGSPTAGQAVWRETVNILPHHTYVFKFCAASWGMNGAEASDPSPAKLVVFVDGSKVGGPFDVVARDGVWSQYVVRWQSSSTRDATISIIDQNTDAFGNDFAIDDLILHPAGV